MKNPSRSIAALIQQLIRWELGLLSVTVLGAAIWSGIQWQAKASNVNALGLKVTLLKVFTIRNVESVLSQTASLNGANTLGE